MVNTKIKLLWYIFIEQLKNPVQKSCQNLHYKNSGYIKAPDSPKNSKRGGKHNLKKFSGKLNRNFH